DTFRYFGTDYTLSIIVSPIEDVKLSGKLILAAVKSEERTGRILKKFYADETAKIFADLNKRTYEMFQTKGYNVPLAELQIRSMTSRWGSCHISDNKIVMNSRLALYPEVCAAYVFIHEYAHFIVPNHSKDFYAVVGDLMPDYKICINMLKK
ncbi:MAG: M48 family metallopeptidase, partial [Oscillospiraceae bacterium]|nr:M48 family metallopeptidase [Oscillospiraceae bacterium]